MAETPKPVHTLVLDTGAIIKNEPPVSTLVAQSEHLVTVPAIISEIRDAATRSRVETTLWPFLTLRSPNPASIKFVTDFARKTGDLAVLSTPDIHIIALTYEIECERNGGDWRLRRVPGQKRLNGSPPAKPAPAEEQVANEAGAENVVGGDDAPGESTEREAANGNVPESEAVGANTVAEESTEPHNVDDAETTSESVTLETAVKDLTIAEDAQPHVDSAHAPGASQEDSDSDSDGWITPSNLKKQQAQDASATVGDKAEPKTMQVGVLTTDFAMQNVILQINLNLLSRSMTRVRHVKTFVLRCHACFQITKEMSRQFCPRCGQPALTRVSCSTDSNGEFRLHLKKNMQWNTRGDRYSVPKPVHGSANGRIKGGGKGGWGNELILTEDQKEYEMASVAEKKQKERSLMDEDYLPGILTGDRGRAGGRIKVGAGRNVNARKR